MKETNVLGFTGNLKKHFFFFKRYTYASRRSEFEVYLKKIATKKINYVRPVTTQWGKQPVYYSLLS